jgi:hypothetical protein
MKEGLEQKRTPRDGNIWTPYCSFSAFVINGLQSEFPQEFQPSNKIK